MVSQGDGEIGAGKLTGEVMDILLKVQLTVDQLIGTEMAKACFFID